MKIDTISVVRNICKKQFDVDNIYEITDAGRISDVSDALTSLINAGGDEGEIKELKNTRSYVNKYRDFLTYCANLSEEALDSTTPYDFAGAGHLSFYVACGGALSVVWDVGG